MLRIVDWLVSEKRSDASLFPAPITVWPDLIGKRGFRRGIRRRRGLGDCRMVVLGERRGIRRGQGSGGRWEVIPGTEQSTPPLAGRSPLRVAKRLLRKGDMMALSRPMGRAER